MTGDQRKKGVVLSYLNMFVQILMNIAYTPIMLRLVGQSEYGIYSLCVSFISYLGLLNLGLNSAYIRYYARYTGADKDEKIARLNGMFLIIFIIIALVALAAGLMMATKPRIFFGSELADTEIALAQILMIIMVINLAISMPNSVFISFATVYEKFIFQRGLTLLQSISTPFLTLPLLFWGYGSIAMVSVVSVLTFIQFILNIYFCWKTLRMKFIFNQFNFMLMKEILGFSFFIFLQTLMDQMNWQVDKLILAHLIGSVPVAIYAVGTQFNFCFMQFSCAVSSVFTPQVHRMIAEEKNREIDLLMGRIGRIQFMISGFIYSAFVFGGEAFIYLWAGEEYRDSYYVAVLIMAPLVITLSQNLGHEVCRAKNVHRVRCMIDLGFSLINMGISIPLVQSHGVIGAAFATFIVMGIQGTVFTGWYLYKVAKIDYLYLTRERLKLLPSMIVPCIVGYFTMTNIIMQDWLTFMVFAVGYTILFYIVMYKLGMNAYEKSLLDKVLSKVNL